MDWYDGLLRDYLAWLLRRGRSPRTVSTWRSPLFDFGRWIDVADVAEPSALERQHIEEWQDRIRARVSSTRTAMNAATALRGLLRYAELEREELGLRVGVWRVAMPKQPDYLPRPLAREDVELILKHYAVPTRDLVFARDRALFATLLTSGARISEVLQMRVDQVARRGVPIIVVQKGDREKRLVISETARTWIEQYLLVRGRDGEGALWIRSVGPGLAAGRAPISQAAVNMRWAVLARRLGIRRFTNHQLRHTAGTELLERGARDTEIAAVLGHANTNMIRRYALVREERRQALVDGLDSLMPAAPGPGRLVRFRRPRRGARRR